MDASASSCSAMNLSRGEMLEWDVGFVGEARDIFWRDDAARLDGVSNAVDMSDMRVGGEYGCV